MSYMFTQEIFQVLLIIYSLMLIFSHSYLAHSDNLIQITTYWLMAHGVVHSLLLTAPMAAFDNGYWHHVFELIFVIICFAAFRGVDWLHAFNTEEHTFEWPIISLVLSIMFFVLSISGIYFDTSPDALTFIPVIGVVLISSATLFYLIYLKLTYDKLKLCILMNSCQFQDVSTLVNRMSDTYATKLQALSQANTPEAHLAIARHKLEQARIPVYSNQLEIASMLAKPEYKAHLRPSWISLNNSQANPIQLALFFELLIQILIAEDLNLQLRLNDHPLIPATWTIEYTPSKPIFPLAKVRNQRVREEMLNLLKVELKLKLDLSIETDNHYCVTVTQMSHSLI